MPVCQITITEARLCDTQSCGLPPAALTALQRRQVAARACWSPTTACPGCSAAAHVGMHPFKCQMDGLRALSGVCSPLASWPRPIGAELARGAYMLIAGSQRCCKATLRP